MPEVQLKKAFLKAKKSKDQTGHALIKLLETRLDAFVLRAGFAQSIRQARQMVVHGHILVDGKRVDKPAYQLQVGQKISLKEKSRSNEMFKENFQTVVGNSYPYIEKDVDKFEAVLSRLPEREEIPIEDVYKRQVYFPLIVHEALMIEPTETESKETLDAYAAALNDIAKVAKENPEDLLNAPLTTMVSRPDETLAARTPVLTYTKEEK